MIHDKFEMHPENIQPYRTILIMIEYQLDEYQLEYHRVPSIGYVFFISLIDKYNTQAS